MAPTVELARGSLVTKAATFAFASGSLATKAATGTECLALPVGWLPASHGRDGDRPTDDARDLGE